MELRQEILQMGASEVGFFRLEAPVYDMEYGVCIVFHLSDTVVDMIDLAPTHTYFHHYRAVNAFLDQLTLKTGILIERRGYRYLCVPASQTVDPAQKAGLFSHKAGARLSGLGTIGKSGLFLSKKYGPRVRLATVLTNMSLPCGQPLEEDICDACDLCILNCPAMALTGASYREGMPREALVDAYACSDYMKRHFQHIGRGSVCGICMRACKKGESI